MLFVKLLALSPVMMRHGTADKSNQFHPLTIMSVRAT